MNKQRLEGLIGNLTLRGFRFGDVCMDWIDEEKPYVELYDVKISNYADEAAIEHVVRNIREIDPTFEVTVDSGVVFVGTEDGESENVLLKELVDKADKLLNASNEMYDTIEKLLKANITLDSRFDEDEEEYWKSPHQITSTLETIIEDLKAARRNAVKMYK